MTPSLSDADRDQLDELVQGGKVFTLLCSEYTYRNWHDRHIAAFESTPDENQSSWELFLEMSPGDILIAYNRQGDRDYFYGIGRVAGTYDESVPCIVGDLDDDDYQYQIPADWITIRSNGERLDKTDISSLSNETVSEINTSRLDEILDAIDQELGEDAPWSRSADDFLSILHQVSESDRLREITTAAMSQGISREDDLLEEILPVIRAYLFETDTASPTSERRSTAVRIVADEEGNDPHQILTQCLQGEIHPRIVDESNDEKLQEQFDSSLEQIEDRWGRYKSETTQATYVVQLGGAYKPEVTYPDLALKTSSLTDDSAAEPESGSRLLYIEEGLCRGEATVSETIDNTDSEGEPLFWIIVKDYKEFAPIEIEEIEAAIGRVPHSR